MISLRNSIAYYTIPVSRMSSLNCFPSELIGDILGLCDIDHVAKLILTGDRNLTYKINNTHQLKLKGYLRSAIYRLDGPALDLDLSEDYALDSLDQLPSSVTGLNVSGLKMIKDYTRISSLSRLRKLNLYDCYIPDNVLLSLPSSITDLNIRGNVNESMCNYISTMELHTCKIFLPASISLSDLRNNATFSDLRNNATLTSLHVSCVSLDRDFSEELQLLPQLTELNIVQSFPCSINYLPSKLISLSFRGLINCMLPSNLTSITTGTIDDNLYDKLPISLTSITTESFIANSNDLRKFTQLRELYVEAWDDLPISTNTIYLPSTLAHLTILDIQSYHTIIIWTSDLPSMTDLMLSDNMELMVDAPMVKLESLVIQTTDQIIDKEDIDSCSTSKWCQMFPSLLCLALTGSDVNEQNLSNLDLRNITTLTSYQQQEELLPPLLPSSIKRLSIPMNIDSAHLKNLVTASIGGISSPVPLVSLGQLSKVLSLDIVILPCSLEELHTQLQLLHPRIYTLIITMKKQGCCMDIHSRSPGADLIYAWIRSRSRYLKNFTIKFDTSYGVSSWSPLK